MGVAENKALVRRFYEEVWDKGNVEFAREVFHDDYVRHDLRPTQSQPGGAGQAKIASDFRRAFPDLRWRVDLILGEGDLIVGRWTATGTHTGTWGTIEPTGKRAKFSGVNIFRFQDGKVIEIWNHRDDLGLATQIGSPVYAGAVTPPNMSPGSGPRKSERRGTRSRSSARRVPQ
jgi:predicted ester cyclase